MILDERPSTGAAERRQPTAPHVPGEPELWILIVGELVVFAALFAAWEWNAVQHRALFAAGHEKVNLWLGVLNTVLLLTGSLAVACGLRARREDRREQARHNYGAAIFCGVGFVLVKAVEYHAHLAHGADLGSTFFTYYFVVTGIHLIHVTVGLLALTVLYRRSLDDSPSMALFDGVGIYWHMVDAVWIVIFYLVYLS